MAIFNRGISKPRFKEFSEEHFISGAKRILWNNERLLADGFFEHGPDPLGEENPTLGLFGANSHTYIAATEWRIILGYLANGNFATYEYQDINPQIRKKRNQYLFTYSNPKLKESAVPNLSPRITFVMSKVIAEIIEKNAGGRRPKQNETTQLHLFVYDYGEDTMGEMAKTATGKDNILMEKCITCHGLMYIPKQNESPSETGNQFCTICLRVRESQ